MSDTIDRYTRLADAFGARVEATTDDKLSAPAPCEEWTARDVIAHVVGGQRTLVVALGGTGEIPLGPDDDVKEAWRQSYAALKEAIQPEGTLSKEVQSPMGAMPAEMFLGRFLANDILVHTWDLARAVGGDELLDQDAVAHAYEGLKPLDAMIRRPGVFGPKVEAPEGADLQTEFLAFLGRKA